MTLLHCLLCNDIIFSRATHDMQTCTCGSHSIDGGFQYIRASFNNPKEFKMITLPVPDAIKQDLYNDWNKQLNKYGKGKYD